MKYIFTVVLGLISFSPYAFAVCDSYSQIAASHEVLGEGVISKIFVVPASYSAGTCNINIKVGFSSLKINGTPQVCKETAAVSKVTSVAMVNSVNDCIKLQSEYLKLLMTAKILGQKISADTDNLGGIDYSGSLGIVLK